MADANAAAFQVLEDKILQLRIKVADVPDDVVPEIAKIIDTEQKRTIAAGQDAYGTPWAPKKRDDGDFRFVTPSDVVTGSIGRTIITRIRRRVPVLHHMGAANGYKAGGSRRTKGGKVPARHIIPLHGKLPPKWAALIKERVLRAFREATA